MNLGKDGAYRKGDLKDDPARGGFGFWHTCRPTTGWWTDMAMVFVAISPRCRPYDTRCFAHEASS